MSKFVTQVAPAVTTVLAAVILALVSPGLSGVTLVAVWVAWAVLATASTVMAVMAWRTRGGHHG